MKVRITIGFILLLLFISIPGCGSPYTTIYLAHQMQDYERAIKFAEISNKNGPYNSMVYYSLGVAFFETNQYKNSAYSYWKANLLFSEESGHDLPESEFFHEAYKYYIKGEYKYSALLFKEVVNSIPNTIDSHGVFK